MTWDTDDVRFYEGHNCSSCGKYEANQWLPDVAQRMADKKLCKGCDFWAEQFQADNQSDKKKLFVVTDSFEHYRMGDPNIINPSFAGFGGREWVVFWKDHSRVASVTRNLWFQGEVPEHLRNIFTPNATLISTTEILKKAHYVELFNL